MIACETCHMGLSKGDLALKSRSWQNGSSVNAKRMEDWVPFHKWYDGSGSPSDWPASGHLPILSADEMKDNPGAKIYPFNNIEGTWWLKNTGSPAEPPYDDVIPNSVATAAMAYYGHTPDESEMQSYDYDGDSNPDHPDAKLVTDTVSFNISHSVQPAADSFTCSDCHGWANWILDYAELDAGYGGSDPISSWGYISLSTSTCQPTDSISVENGNRYFGDSQDGFADPREVTNVRFKANGKGVNLVVKSWSDSEIVVKIPGKAKLENKFGTGCLPLTGKIFVKNGTNNSNKKNLTINL